MKQIPSKLFIEYFKKPYFVTSFEDFDNLLEYILIFSPSPEQSNLNIENIFENLSQLTDDEELLQFFHEQIKLSNTESNGRRYSIETIMKAFTIYIKSPAAYESLRGFLYLPTTRTFRKYSSPYGDSVRNYDENAKYLKEQFKNVNPRDKYITLKFDEVQIKKNLEYKQKEITGYSDNRPDELASHVQAYMISSLFSSYKEIVRLIPVHRQNTDFLYLSLSNVIKILEEI